MIVLRLFVLVAAFAITAIVVLPLRLAWAGAGAPADLHVDAVRGTIWSGELLGVTWRGIGLGDLAVTSSAFDRPGDLVLNARSDTGPITSIAVPLSSHGSVAERITASMDLAAVLPGAPAGARLRLDHGSITLKGDRCVSASGTINVNAVPTQAMPAFNGGLDCSGGALTASVASADSLHKLTLQVALSANSRPVVTQASAASQLWLAAMGIPIAAPEGGQ
jgi:hypothetical protein